MKKNAVACSLILIICSVFLASCFSPFTENDDVGFIVINLGSGTSDARAVTWPPHQELLASISYKIELRRYESKPDDYDTAEYTDLAPITFPAGKTHQKHKISVQPGFYTIFVTAELLDRTTFATGFAEATVQQGQTASTDPSPIRMQKEDLEYYIPISTAAQLARIADPSDTDYPFDGKYLLVNDITLEGNWTPIGATPTSAFTGTFDGNGKVITGLTITGGIGNLGMFGVIGSKARVENLKLVNCNITGIYPSIVGGLAGQNDRGTIQNCSVTGSVEGWSPVGGLVGNNSGIINNSSFHGNFVRSNGNETGGIAGLNSGTVENCLVIGHVEGEDIVGGVMGNNAGGILLNSAFRGASVRGVDKVGGVLGFDNGGTVENCYATGNVSGRKGVGGVVGESTGSGSIVRYSYASGEVIAQDDEAGGVAGYVSTVLNNCVALNPNISAFGSAFGRVAGNFALGSLSNNFARSDMLKDGNLHTWNTSETSGNNNGTDVNPASISESWWKTTARWDSVWGNTSSAPWQWDNAHRRPKLWFE